MKFHPILLSRIRLVSLLLYLQIALILSLSAQTKSETEAWVLDKLKNNSQWCLESFRYDGYTSNTFRQDFNYRIAGGNLVVTFVQSSSKSSTMIKMEPWDKTEVRVKLIIPLQDFESIAQVGKTDEVEGYTLRTDQRSIKVYYNDKLSGEAKRVTLGLRINRENLLERLNKAMLHLRSFYPRRKIKEVF